MSLQLYNLVHSMNKAEKKYFKMYISSLGTKNKLAELFDIINKQKKYNELKLNTKMGNLIKSNLISYEKHKLKNTLLEALTNLHFNGKKPFSLGDIVNKIELGFKLKNPDIIKEWIEKGWQSNEEERKNGLEFILKIYEGKLTQFISNDNEKVAQIKEEAILICNKMKLDLEYGKLHQAFKIWYNKNITLPNSEEAHKTHIALIENPLFQAAPNTLPLYQKTQLYFCHQYNNHFLGDYKNAILVSKQLIALYESENRIRRGEYHAWASEYPNLIISLLKNNDFDEAYSCILEMESKIELLFPTDNPVYSIAKQRSFNLETKYFIWTKQYHKILENEQKIITLIDNSLPNEFNYNIVVLNRLIEASFALKEYEKALAYIDYYYVNIKNDERINQVYVRFYEFAIYTILKANIKQESVLNSLTYFIRTLHAKDPSIMALMSLVRKIHSDNSFEKTHIAEVKSKLNPESKIRFQPFFDWLKSINQLQVVEKQFNKKRQH